MKRAREETPRPAGHTLPAQRIVEEPGEKTKSGPKALVLHSPYGNARNTLYGWGDLFHPARPALVPGYEESIHIGISSLNAVPGKGTDRSMRRLLQRYRHVFSTLEHCYPYHHVAEAETWASWADMVRSSRPMPEQPGTDTRTTAITAATAGGAARRFFVAEPSRFQYTIKANNLLTHEKQLNMDDAQVIEHVRLFFGTLCRQLDPFLGPVLVQLPPSFQRSPANLARLVALEGQLPKDELEVELESPASAAQSSDRASSPARTFYRRRRVRIAVEFRHRSWFHEETFRTLRGLGWALVVAHHHDSPTFATPVDTGAAFMYVRLHGALGAYVGDYGPSQMDLWAERVLQFLQQPPSLSAAPFVEGQGEGEEEEEEEGGTTDGRPRRQRVPCPREVFFFLNNSDSHVAGVTSSTVDARYLAAVLQARLAPPPAQPCPPAAQSYQNTTLAADRHETSEPHSSHAAGPPRQPPPVVSVDDHSVSILSIPSLVIEESSIVQLDSQASANDVDPEKEDAAPHVPSLDREEMIID